MRPRRCSKFQRILLMDSISNRFLVDGLISDHLDVGRSKGAKTSITSFVTPLSLASALLSCLLEIDRRGPGFLEYATPFVCRALHRRAGRRRRFLQKTFLERSASTISFQDCVGRNRRVAQPGTGGFQLVSSACAGPLRWIRSETFNTDIL